MLTIVVNDEGLIRFLLSNPLGDHRSPFLILQWTASCHGPRWGWPIVPQNEQG